MFYRFMRGVVRVLLALVNGNARYELGSGTDIAMETADVTLMNSSLASIAQTIELSRLTLRKIKQNL
ncbi:hypothetical protein, partial [Enterococcus faecium]|uniref:hypothetical protein n=1 Tax=Enterococcus faecium TaxID=1352 RepID=UPI00292E85B6